MNLIKQLIDTLTVDDLTLLSIIEFYKGQIIFKKDQICEEIVIITNGEIQMVNFDINGNEQIFNYLYSPSIFGNNLIFSTSNRYLSNIIATKKGKGYIIKKDNLLKILRKNEDFLTVYLRILADKTINITQKMKILSIQNAKDRLLSYLIFISENKDVIKITSITNLAKEICLTRETTSRLLYSLIHEGILTYKNKCIKINKNALESL